jgi:hypothetical protein
MSAVVSKKGVKPSDVFLCADCGESITGSQVLEGEMVYYLKQDRSNPNNSEYRCENCQDDIWNTL